MHARGRSGIRTGVSDLKQEKESGVSIVRRHVPLLLLRTWKVASLVPKPRISPPRPRPGQARLFACLPATQ
jgi:hypothetical protein